MIRQRSLAARDLFCADRRGPLHADDAGQYSGNQLKPSCTALDDSSSGLKIRCLQTVHPMGSC